MTQEPNKGFLCHDQGHRMKCVTQCSVCAEEQNNNPNHPNITGTETVLSKIEHCALALSDTQLLELANLGSAYIYESADESSRISTSGVKKILEKAAQLTQSPPPSDIEKIIMELDKLSSELFHKQMFMEAGRINLAIDTLKEISKNTPPCPTK